MSINKFYHKIVNPHKYFIDGLYINYALPSTLLKDLKYSFHSRDYVEHKVFEFNKLEQCNLLVPYPSKLEIEKHPYWFLLKFLSFVKQSLLGDLNDIKNNINHQDLRNVLASYALKREKKYSVNSQGIRMGIGKHHNLQIQFDGKFFRHNTLSKDLKQIKSVGTRLHEIFAMHFLQIPEWNHVDVPRPTIYQLHIAENLISKKYQKLNRKIPLYPNSKKFEDKIKSKPQVKQGAYVDITTQSITGFTHGFKGSYLVTVYNKSLDTPEAQKHSIERFGRSDYWRREFQIGTKKLRSCGIRYFAEFLRDFKKEQFRSLVIRNIRKTADICVFGDSKLYLKFHDRSLKLSARDKLNANNPLKYNSWKLDIKTMKVSNIKWNPYKNIVGNLNSHHSKTLTTEELLKINIKSILVMLQNRRGAFVHGRSNKDQLLQMHEKGFELIDALKNYGEFSESISRHYLSLPFYYIT